MVDEIALTMRLFDPSETAYINETTCKVRWPRDQFNWAKWREIYTPQVTHTLSTGRAIVASADVHGIPIVLGFALFDRNESLDMLAVKRPFIGNGIGLRLLKASGVKDLVITLPTPQWERWTKHHDIKWRQHG